MSDIVNSNTLVSVDFNVAASSGLFPGLTGVNKFGENFAVAKDTQEDIWDGGGDYTYPTTADITHIHQATDQAALRGGTIQVQGLDADWALVVQDATLDATDTTTLVALATPLIRVFRVKVQENVIASSDLHVTNAGDTIEYAKILQGNNQTLMALYTVPAGKTAYMRKYYATMTLGLVKEPKGVNIRLWAADRAAGYEFQLKHSVGLINGGGQIEHEFLPAPSFTEKTDLRMSALAYDAIGQVSAGFDLILVDNL